MIEAIIKSAGNKLKNRYYSLNQCTVKEKFDLVTESDLLVEKLLIEDLKEHYPNCSIFSEEAGQIGNHSKKRWIIDPIDGTADFIFGVPYFAISLCLEDEGEIVEGYVYNPVSEEFYCSKKEEISLLNGEPITTSQTTVISNSLIALGYSSVYEKITRYYDEWKYVFETCKKGMPLITPALTICNVARGRIDAFIDFGCSMEGQAAAALILKNAGGKVWNYDFGEWSHTTKGIIATNGKLDLERYKA